MPVARRSDDLSHDAGSCCSTGSSCRVLHTARKRLNSAASGVSRVVKGGLRPPSARAVHVLVSAHERLAG